MKTLKIGYILACSLMLTASMCGPSPSDTTSPVKGLLKITLVDSLSVEYDDGVRRIPEDIRKLCAVLTSTSQECNRNYVLDPSIIRLDLNNQEISLRTEIKRGGAKNVENVKVISKLIQKNFNEIEIPKVFTSRQASGKEGIKLISDFVTTKVSKDSVLVFSQDASSDTYLLNNRKYKVYTDVEDVRNRMLAILCENEKANFTLLVNPPIASVPPVTDKPQPSVVSAKKEAKIPKTSTGRSLVQRTTRERPTGDLTIIKGSEGCEGCTRYYSATDNLGRTHEIRERSSINCCPCGKTVQTNGRTYRMDCSEGANRLTLVE